MAPDNGDRPVAEWQCITMSGISGGLTFLTLESLMLAVTGWLNTVQGLPTALAKALPGAAAVAVYIALSRRRTTRRARARVIPRPR